MTVAELREKLADMPGDAIVDVTVEDYHYGDIRVEGVWLLEVRQGPNTGAWVTLQLEERERL